MTAGTQKPAKPMLAVALGLIVVAVIIGVIAWKSVAGPVDNRPTKTIAPGQYDLLRDTKKPAVDPEAAKKKDNWDGF